MKYKLNISKLLIFLMFIVLLPINVVDAKASLDDFDRMQIKWRENVVGNLEDKHDLKSNEYIKEFISSLSDEANALYEEMNNTGDGGSLWTRKKGERKSSYLTRNFKNLNVLVKAYSTVGTDLYQNKKLLIDIENALEYLVDVEKYDGNKYYGNWWDWQIGIPHEFVDILMIIKEDIGNEKTQRYVDVIHQYVPDPYKQLQGLGDGEKFTDFKYVTTTKGANRTDFAKTILGIGILKKDEKIVRKSLESIVEVFEYVEKGDGFYEDGSFIFHEDTPYIGSYGMDLIKSVSNILNIVVDTEYDMDDSLKEHFLKLAHDSTLPFIFNGFMSPMVEGRAIARESNQTENAQGSPAVKTLAQLAFLSNNEYSVNIKKAVKLWIEQNPNYYLSISNSFQEIISVINILESDIDVTGHVPFLGSKMFPKSDRFVFGENQYNVGISMHSNRISAFTVGNNENLKPWHLSDGVIYLQNGDKQFGKSYWPTVDLYRLPGTTVDTRILEDEKKAWSSHRSSEPFVGGSYSNKNAAIAMQLNKENARNNDKDIGMNLKAKKSWFIIDGNIVSLGSDIKGQSPATIETVVENRLLDENFQYQLKDCKNNLINSGKILLKENDYLILESTDIDKNIGYLFLKDEIVTVDKQIRKGDYSKLSSSEQSGNIYSEEYQTIVINHGNNVDNDSYSYVVLPNTNKEEITSFRDAIRVLKNNAQVQAVYDDKNKILAANIWDSRGASLENIEVDRSVSIVVEEGNAHYDVYISDPTQELKEVNLRLTHFNGRIDDKRIILNEVPGDTVFVQIPKPANKGRLKQEKSIYDEIVYEDLTVYSQLKYDELMKKAQNILKDENITQEQTNLLTKTMKETRRDFDYRLNIEKSKNLIKQYKVKNPTIYTTESWSEYKSMIESLNQNLEKYNIFEKLIVTQSNIDRSNLKIQKAYDNLVIKTHQVDYMELINLMTEYNSLERELYNKEFLDELDKQAQEIKENLYNLEITQEDVNKISNNFSEILNSKGD